jgi:hypothetical protein
MRVLARSCASRPATENRRRSDLGRRSISLGDLRSRISQPVVRCEQGASQVSVQGDTEARRDRSLAAKARAAARGVAGLRRYVSEIFSSVGMDLDTPGTRRTPERFSRALHDPTAGYEGDPKLVTGFLPRVVAPARPRRARSSRARCECGRKLDLYLRLGCDRRWPPYGSILSWPPSLGWSGLRDSRSGCIGPP